MLHFGEVVIDGDQQEFEDSCQFLGINTKTRTTTTSDDKLSDQEAPAKKEDTISNWLQSTSAVCPSDTERIRCEMRQLETMANNFTEMYKEAKDVAKGMKNMYSILQHYNLRNHK